MSEKEKVEDKESELLVVDPDDYRQTRQIRNIHDTKEKYQELRRSEETFKREVHVRRVRNLIEELEPLMRRLETETDYLDGVHIGTVTQFDENVKVWYENVGVPEPTKKQVVEHAIEEGVAQELDLEGVTTLATHTGYRGYTKKRRHRPQSQSRTTERCLEPSFTYFSRGTCNNVYRYCREFMSEAGLGLQVEEDSGPAKI